MLNFILNVKLNNLYNLCYGGKHGREESTTSTRKGSYNQRSDGTTDRKTGPPGDLTMMEMLKSIFGELSKKIEESNQDSNKNMGKLMGDLPKTMENLNKKMENTNQNVESIKEELSKKMENTLELVKEEVNGNAAEQIQELEGK